MHAGVREGQRIVLPEQAVDMVAVIVRDDDSINGVGINPDRREIGEERAVEPLGALVGGFTVAGVDDCEMAAGVDDDRVIRGLERLGFHDGGGQCRLHIGLARIRHKAVGHRYATLAIGDHRHFEAAELVAVIARRLFAGLRHGRTRRCARNERAGGGQCSAGVADEHLTAGKHDSCGFSSGG